VLLLNAPLIDDGNEPNSRLKKGWEPQTAVHRHNRAVRDASLGHHQLAPEPAEQWQRKRTVQGQPLTRCSPIATRELIALITLSLWTQRLVSNRHLHFITVIKRTVKLAGV
jgi:hypothetical protein